MTASAPSDSRAAAPRVVMVLPAYLPESYGGAEQQTRRLARALARRGAAVTLLAPRVARGTPARERRGPGCRPALPSSCGSEPGRTALRRLPVVVRLHLHLAVAKQTQLRRDLRGSWPSARVPGGDRRKVARQAGSRQTGAGRRSALRPLGRAPQAAARAALRPRHRAQHLGVGRQQPRDRGGSLRVGHTTRAGPRHSQRHRHPGGWTAADRKRRRPFPLHGKAGRRKGSRPDDPRLFGAVDRYARSPDDPRRRAVPGGARGAESPPRAGGAHRLHGAGRRRNAVPARGRRLPVDLAVGGHVERASGSDEPCGDAGRLARERRRRRSAGRRDRPGFSSRGRISSQGAARGVAGDDDGAPSRHR